MWTIIIIIVGILIIATLFDKRKKHKKGTSADPAIQTDVKSIKSEKGKEINDSRSANNPKLEKLINLTDQKFSEFKKLDFADNSNDVLVFKLIAVLVIISLKKHEVIVNGYKDYSLKEYHKHILQKSGRDIEFDKNRKLKLYDSFVSQENELRKMLLNKNVPSGGYDRNEYNIEITSTIEMMYVSLTRNYDQVTSDEINKFKKVIFDTFANIDQKVKELSNRSN